MSTAVGQAVDKEFLNSPAETRTESEKQFQLEFLSMASALINAIRIVSYVVLLILMLILANTIAMSVRERTHEYGVLRAIGFPPGHILGFILGIFIVAAFLTPPDAVSQCFMAVPMYLLYELGIVMSRILLKNKLTRAQVDAEKRMADGG